MANNNNAPAKEKFKTMIGGQALIEGIMMRGPEKDAIVVRTPKGLQTEVHPRKIRPAKSIKTWPFIRGIFNFFDSQVVGIKALMRSADLAPEEMQEEPSKLDLWLEKKLSSETFQKVVVGIAMVLGVGLSVVLFFLLPMVISRMKDMRRVFSYHGAEHKTIRCYEAGLPLTVENVRAQTRLHPRCGTSFLLVVMVISILVFSVASSALLSLVPALEAMRGSALYRVIMIAFKLLLLPVVVGITYEINRWAGRHDNWFTRAITAPGMWMQHFTTNEPDDSMIEVGIAAVTAVLPEKEGSDLW